MGANTFRVVMAGLVLCAAGFAHAQPQSFSPPSPYSLGFSVDRAPIGLNVSMVGRAQMASALAAFGKVGTTTLPRPDTATMGMSSTSLPFNDPGTAMSWGGGVSWDFTPRLTATFEWISYDLRIANGPVRSTNLGLQYRY